MTIRSAPQKELLAPSNSKGHAIAASMLRRELSVHEFPGEHEWKGTSPIAFCTDWQGKNSDPERATEVRVLWSPETLFIRFDCRYREIWVFGDSDPNGRRDGLWDRDVAEVFLQPDDFGSRNYKEFEISPNGLWVDLQISEAPRRDLKSGLRCQARTDESRKTWLGMLAIPIHSLTANFDPSKTWRANFFRAEGRDPHRAYLAWSPTHTAEPQFHVPAAFRPLKFQTS